MNLRDQLDDLAGEMNGTDLTDLRRRVDRASRRLRSRRMLATSCAAAVTVLAVLVAGGALLRAPGGAPAPPSTHLSTPPPSAAPVGAVPGELSFLTLKAGRPIELHRYLDGIRSTVTFGTATSRDIAATPSPDGTRLAIHTSPDRDRIAPGDLVVATGGGTRRTVARNVRWDGGNTAVWTPDGSALVAGGVRYDATTGASEPLPDRPQYLAYSPRGMTVAYAFQSDTIKVSTEGGGATRTVSVAGLQECERTAGCPTSVQAVSDSGMYVALGNVNSDPSHVYGTALIYHTVKRKRVELGTFEHAWFRADGTLLVTATEARLLDLNWKVVGTFPLPAHDPDAVMFYRG